MLQLPVLSQGSDGNAAIRVQACCGIGSLHTVLALFELAVVGTRVRGELIRLPHLLTLPTLPRLLHGYQLLNPLLMQLQTLRPFRHAQGRLSESRTRKGAGFIIGYVVRRRQPSRAQRRSRGLI